MLRRLLLGAAAGAAGTTALHAATYLDMALRGRPASRTPEQTVQAMADRLGVEIPGSGAVRENRLSGLGAVSGIATGVGVGMTFGLLDALRLRPRGTVGMAVAGGGAMLFSNTTMTRYGVTDPRSWDVEDWLSDVVPHACFGVVLSATYSLAVDPPPSRGRLGHPR